MSSLPVERVHKQENTLTKPTVLRRATKWTTSWPLTSVRCWPQWTSSTPGAPRPSELLTGRRLPSSSGSCARSGSRAAGAGPSLTSCGGWASALLLAPSEAASPRILLLQAATTPWKAPADVTSATWTWMKTSRRVRMTTSKTYSISAPWVFQCALSHGAVCMLLFINKPPVIISMQLIQLKHVCTYSIWFLTVDHYYYLSSMLES